MYYLHFLSVFNDHKYFFFGFVYPFLVVTYYIIFFLEGWYLFLDLDMVFQPVVHGPILFIILWLSICTGTFWELEFPFLFLRIPVCPIDFLSNRCFFGRPDPPDIRCGMWFEIPFPWWFRIFLFQHRILKIWVYSVSDKYTLSFFFSKSLYILEYFIFWMLKKDFNFSDILKRRTSHQVPVRRDCSGPLDNLYFREPGVRSRWLSFKHKIVLRIH